MFLRLYDIISYIAGHLRPAATTGAVMRLRCIGQSYEGTLPKLIRFSSLCNKEPARGKVWLGSPCILSTNVLDL